MPRDRLNVSMDWRVALLIAYIISSWCLPVSALQIVNVNTTNPTTFQSVNPFGAASTVLPASPTPSSYGAIGQKAATSSAAASSPTGLSASALSQVAAAASSQALARASSTADSGSEVGVFAQVIIAIGVIPVELLIVAVVLGVHRLRHGRPTRPLQTRAEGTKSKRNSLPYVQPKAELEDEQRRRHELHGVHLVHEVDGENGIFQLPDGTESLVLPLQGTRGIHEMPDEGHMSWEMPLQGRSEIMGDELAQELECPVQRSKESTMVGSVSESELESPARARNESMESDSAQELDSPVLTTDEPIGEENARGLAAPVAVPVTDCGNVNPSRSHFMFRQQEMQHTDSPMTTDAHDANETRCDLRDTA